jgi:uncharacterized protein (TIGR02646 family)
MIKINKGNSPAALARAKAKYDRTNNAAYLAHRADYNSGAKTFTFTSAYKSDAVKAALKTAQHGKCCFSEAKFVSDEAHVEHFRPKGFVEDRVTGAISYPGYYWLAYDWENLFFCKSMTNSSTKRNFFPLMRHGLRRRNHTDTRIENSVLIDPAAEDPRLHIRFKNEEIKGITIRGKRTIELLDLRNGQLDEARRTKFYHLKVMKNAADLLIGAGFALTTPELAELINELRQSVLPQAEFSSMAIDFLQGWPHLH